MNLNAKQIVAIAIAVLSVLAGSANNLTDLFGPGVAKAMVSAATLLTTTLSSVLAVITSQASSIAEVRSIATTPGAAPALVQQAKVALLDATASLPEVPNNIMVTDKKLADAAGDQVELSPAIR